MFVNIQNSNEVSKYEFDTRTAKFYICKNCGVVPFAISEIESSLYAVVNANTFYPIDKVELNIESVSHDNESVSDRLQRRKRNWISKVIFEE